MLGVTSKSRMVRLLPPAVNTRPPEWVIEPDSVLALSRPPWIGNEMPAFEAFASAIVAGEYLLGLLPRGTHEYAKFIQPAELMRWARASALTPQAMRGLGYSPITQRYSITNDTSVNYMIATQKI